MRLSPRRFHLIGGLILLTSVSPLLAGVTPIPVTNTDDSGPGSLRDAIAIADDGDLIYFNAALLEQTIYLTSGELLINKSIHIAGPGPDWTGVSRFLQGPAFRIFHVVGPSAVQIQGLTISNGQAVGGGIWNEHATLTLHNCVFRQNVSPENSGAIYNDGTRGSATLTMASCTINNNFADGLGGGIHNDASNGGSAILALWNSNISENRAFHVDTFNPAGAGGGIYNNGTGANVTLTNCTINQNQAVQPPSDPVPQPVGRGGGLYNGGGVLTIINSTITENEANRISPPMR